MQEAVNWTLIKNIYNVEEQMLLDEYNRTLFIGFYDPFTLADEVEKFFKKSGTDDISIYTKLGAHPDFTVQGKGYE